MSETKSRTAIEAANEIVAENGILKTYGDSESQKGYFIMIGLTAIAEQIGELAKAIIIHRKGTE